MCLHQLSIFRRPWDTFPLNFTPMEFASVPDQYTVSPNEVYEALSNIKIHKAHGPDNIPNWFLKSNAGILSSTLSSIFNASICQDKYNKTPVTTDELRPISLTPTVSKILLYFLRNRRETLY